MRERGVEFDVIEYLDHPLERADFERFLSLLPNAPADLVRKDKNFKALGLNADDYTTAETVVDVLLEHSHFSVGDDCVAIKSGWDCFGYRIPAP